MKGATRILRTPCVCPRTYKPSGVLVLIIPATLIHTPNGDPSVNTMPFSKGHLNLPVTCWLCKTPSKTSSPSSEHNVYRSFILLQIDTGQVGHTCSAPRLHKVRAGDMHGGIKRLAGKCVNHVQLAIHVHLLCLWDA